MKCSSKLVGIVVGMAVAGTLTLPAVALAGGATIASAPTVVYGQDEFGNTATDSASTCPQLHEQDSWWLLPVTAGDRVTIDFEGPGAHKEQLWPIGTNDFNFSDSTPFQSIGTSGGKQEVVTRVPQTGVMPLEFLSLGDCGSTVAGPYDFTAYVAHQVVLSLQAHANRSKHFTVFTVGLHNPDGAVITSPSLRCHLQQLKRGSFMTVATSAPPCNLRVRWSRGQRHRSQTLRAQVYGSGYMTTKTRNIHVKGV